MKLRLLGLVANNFKCLESIAIDFRDLPLGLLFVKGCNEVEPTLGSNASGKTSLWDSACWALYGKTTDGLRNPDIRSWGSNKRTQVILNLARDGEPYRVSRVTPDNSLEVEGKTVGQDQIDKDIMPFSVFTNTLLLGQGRPLFFDLKPMEKMDLFSEVLELDRWEARSQLAADRVKAMLDKETRLLAEIDATKTALAEFRDLRRKIREQYKEWEEERRAKRGYEKQRLADLKKVVVKQRALKEQLEEEQEDLRSGLLLAKDRLRDHERDLRDLEKERAELLALFKQTKQRYREMVSELESLDEAEVCPTCGQPVSEENLLEHRNELQSKLDKMKKPFLAAGDELGKLRNDVQVAADLVESTKTIIEKDEGKLAGCTEELAKARVSLMATEDKLSELESLEVEENPYQTQLSELKVRVSNYKETLLEVEEQLRKLRIRAGRVKFWIQGFKACRLYMLEEILDELRLVTNSICPEVGLHGWEIGYEVERETKSGTIKRGLIVTVNSPGFQGLVRWESFSGGEQQRLRLVGALALSEVLLNHAGIESDFIVLDEPTRSMSEEGINDLCDLLPYYARRLGRRVFYIDHRVVESSNFASTISVVRRKTGVEVMVG